MLQTLTSYSDYGLLALRIAVGLIFIIHSQLKLKDVKGAATMIFGKPEMAWFSLLHGLAELLGGIAIIIGFFLQINAIILAVIIIGAIYFKIFKWKMKFMQQAGTGWEFDLILLAALIALIFTAGGNLIIIQ